MVLLEPFISTIGTIPLNIIEELCKESIQEMLKKNPITKQPANNSKVIVRFKVILLIKTS
jgi:hypothetical protein